MIRRIASVVPTGGVPFFSNRGKKIVLVIGGIIATVVIFRALKGFIKRQDSREEVREAYNELEEMNSSPTTRQKISSFQAQQYANTLFSAMDGYGTNETAIFGVFYKLFNDADFLAVSKSFGVREISSGYLNPEPNMKGTMTECLHSELAFDDRKKVNDILKAKKIRFRV
jgi:hypothetical protein